MKQDSGLTDNAWVQRVGEIRQMVADVASEPTTQQEVDRYIDAFDLEFSDEETFARQEFARQYKITD